MRSCDIYKNRAKTSEFVLIQSRYQIIQMERFWIFSFKNRKF